jgi:hypothetical protein
LSSKLHFFAIPCNSGVLLYGGNYIELHSKQRCRTYIQLNVQETKNNFEFYSFKYGILQSLVYTQLKKGCPTRYINHKRYDPIGLWENRHSSLFAFTRWLFGLKYVHKENTMNCLYFQYVLYTFKILENWSCYMFFDIWEKVFVLEKSNFIQKPKYIVNGGHSNVQE